MPPGVAQHVVYASDGTALTLDVDEDGGLPVIESDGTVLSLTLTEA